MTQTADNVTCVLVLLVLASDYMLNDKPALHLSLFAENRPERKFTVNIDEKHLIWFTLAPICQENVKNCKKRFCLLFLMLRYCPREHENVSPSTKNTREYPFILIMFAIHSCLFSVSNDISKPSIEEKRDIPKTVAQQTLREDLKKKKMWTHVVPRELMMEQHERSMPACKDLLSMNTSDENNSSNIITGDES